MPEVVRSTILDAPVDAVWRVLRDFNGHDRWHPAIATSALEQNRLTDQVGAVRSFVLRGGERLRERLLDMDDAARRFRYAIVESEVPLIDYVAEVELRPVTDGDRTWWRWSSRFRTPPGEEEALATLVAAGVYEAGFAAVRERVERRARSARTGGAVADRSPVARAAPASPAAPRASLPGRAVRVVRFGGPDALVAGDVEAPPPGPGEARVRQHAVGVNFIDVYARTGRVALLSPPAVPGVEASGTVVDVGPGVSRVGPGARVGYAAPPPGAYASVRTLPADLLVALPDALTHEEAAATLLKGVTAGFLVRDVHRVEPGQVALVHAPAGGVGQLLCRWASRLGATVLGVTSTPEKAAVARAAGCAHVLLRGEGDVAARVRELTGGHGADVVYDAVGRDAWDASVASLARRGHLVSYGQASGDLGARDVAALSSTSSTLSRPNYGHFVDSRERLERATGRLFDALADGTLEVPAFTRVRLERAADAHRALESGATIGPLVLTAGDAP